VKRERKKKAAANSLVEPVLGDDEVAKEMVAEAIENTSTLEAKKAAAAAAVETSRAASNEDMKEIVVAAVDAVPEESKRDVAVAAMQSLNLETQEQVLARLQRLPRQEREQIAGLLLPDQPVTNRIWTIIVGAFALVFVLSAIALFVVALQTGEIQTLLTVVTTIAGILAGFISGRASSTGNRT